MHIGRNQYTREFGRDYRFLVDEPGSKEMMAFALTKPLKVGHTYADQGIYSFVLQEVVNTDDDNFELGVADYYKYFPKNTEAQETAPNVEDKYQDDRERKKVWF